MNYLVLCLCMAVQCRCCGPGLGHIFLGKGMTNTLNLVKSVLGTTSRLEGTWAWTITVFLKFWARTVTTRIGMGPGPFRPEAQPTTIFTVQHGVVASN